MATDEPTRRIDRDLSWLLRPRIGEARQSTGVHLYSSEPFDFSIRKYSDFEPSSSNVNFV